MGISYVWPGVLNYIPISGDDDIIGLGAFNEERVFTVEPEQVHNPVNQVLILWAEEEMVTSKNREEFLLGQPKATTGLAELTVKEEKQDKNVLIWIIKLMGRIGSLST